MKELIIILLVLCLLMAGYGPESEVDKVYLFNGTKLPELPEFNAESFAYISAHPLIEGAYALYVSDLEPVYSWDTNTMTPAEGATVQWARCWNDEWSELSDWDADSTLPPIWSNFNVKGADGKAYLDASQQVEMWEHTKSFLIGLALGLAGKPLPISQGKEPIGYLYGHIAKEGETATHTIDGVGYVGVVCPDIASVPSEDLGIMQPNRLIVRNGDSYYIYQSDNPFFNNGSQFYLYGPGSFSSYLCVLGKSWFNSNRGFTPYTLSEKCECVWSSHDILYKDSTEVYLAASDCVCLPIYE